MGSFETILGAAAKMLYGGHDRSWQPACDVYRTAFGWVVKFELAGVCPEDVAVGVSGRNLIVRGVRRDTTLREGLFHYQMEISYSRFERILALPADLSRARLGTEYANGLLLVTLEMDLACQETGDQPGEGEQP